MSNILNVDFKKGKTNPTIDADCSLYELPFYKDNEYFVTPDNMVSFVKAVEKLVRKSKYYARYISYIKQDIGINQCQVLSNIHGGDDETTKNTVIEMHHGPILTLFDYGIILVEYMLSKNKKITTFKIADMLIDEHFANRVQIVMLSESIHREVHDGNIFLSTKQAFGDLNAFLEMYSSGITDEQKIKINRYIDLSSRYDSNHNGVLDINPKLLKTSI
jgi:hypothetical protein